MSQDLFIKQLESSYLTGLNSYYIEDLYEQYLSDSNSVTAEWRDCFSQLSKEQTSLRHSAILAQLKSRDFAASNAGNIDATDRDFIFWLTSLRENGFRCARVNPLVTNVGLAAYLEPDNYNIVLSDKILSSKSSGLNKDMTIKRAVEFCKNVYCGSVGLEASHIFNKEIKSWLWSYIETLPAFKLTDKQQLQLYSQVVAANHFEQFLSRKFVAQKRFSLEGGDALIPLIDAMIEHGAANHSLQEVALAMAHRGRLNLMANIFGVSMDTISKRFTGESDISIEISGDVKYHLGASIDRDFNGKNVHLSLACNPSHLEFVNPVLQGVVRAKQDKYYKESPVDICGITIHGDAAVCGQGVVPETLNLMRTNAHNIHGMVHVVINNQVGHSVSSIADMTSCNYVTDVFKSFDIPVLHVNADDPEAVVFCAKLAMDYRFKFKADIAIELLCYRRLGHNEADEPSITQPLMYKKIKNHPRLFVLYKEYLLSKGVVEASLLNIEKHTDNIFQQGKSIINCQEGEVTFARRNDWQKYCSINWQEKIKTNYNIELLKDLAVSLQDLPDNFVCQKQISRLIQQREKMVAGEVSMNWGMAELLAYASLVKSGVPVRLVGQDVRRGTFSHRQAVLHDFETGAEHDLFAKIIGDNGAKFEVFDSTLSETAVLGAEYGYSLANANALVLWEAQFGDFANSAQVIIDQFISSAWQKWQQLSGIVLLLPHGYEGQGPEHSSARLERFLQLSAQHSMQVCVPTTPAQLFHLLRRQVLRSFKQPLVVMSPKSLLRHPLAVSSYEDLASGEFLCAIDDQMAVVRKVTRVVVCSGKIYYELLEQRQKSKVDNIALVRIEQLYPFPYDLAKSILARYVNATEIVWCQEEPKNQGAWFARRHCLEASLSSEQRLLYVGREMYSSTAAGSPKLHKVRQQSILMQALGLDDISPVKYD